MDAALGPSELLPAVAILPFMIFQLAGFGTLTFVVPRAANWGINLAILALIVVSYIGNRTGSFHVERAAGSALVLGLALVVWYGIVRLKSMQADFDRRSPPKKED
jgi:hypothetical protein